MMYLMYSLNPDSIPEASLSSPGSVILFFSSNSDFFEGSRGGVDQSGINFTVISETTGDFLINDSQFLGHITRKNN